MKRLRKIDRCLASESCNNSLRLFKLYDVHYILYAQGLEIQLVGGGVVCRDGLRIVVDDDGFVSGFLDGLNRMHGGIIKFNTLSDPDGPCPEHYHLGLIRDH